MKRRLKVTAVIEDGEGDSLCMSCKHVFGIVNCTGLSDIGAEANFCPHCGASIVYLHHLDKGESLADVFEAVGE